MSMREKQRFIKHILECKVQQPFFIDKLWSLSISIIYCILFFFSRDFCFLLGDSTPSFYLDKFPVSEYHLFENIRSKFFSLSFLQNTFDGVIILFLYISL